VRVLVTGGAGFVGSHLVDLLMAEGHEVTVLDNFSSGKMENLKVHLNNPRFRLVRGDVRDRRTVEECVMGVDWAVHEAAMVSIQESMGRPELARDVNVNGTRVLLEACLDAEVKKIVFASSCAVYGVQEKLPISEDANPNPLSPYAESKLEAEGLCLEFNRKGLSVVCLRYFNVYGPRQLGGEYAGVMVKFAERLMAGLPPKIFGDGKQTRDFVHVSDVARATLAALESEGAEGEVINIGTGKETSINELCRIFLGISGKNVRPVHLPPLQGEVRRSSADLRKAREILGFKPRVGIKEGVGKFWKWMLATGSSGILL